MLNALRKSKERRQLAAELHAALVARAREPEFFATFGIKDTLDGRFDLIALHAWLVLERLREAGASSLSQSFIDAVFVGFDEGLRELGAGDIGMGKRVKKLADAFYGRMQAYGEACGRGRHGSRSDPQSLSRGAGPWRKADGALCDEREDRG